MSSFETGLFIFSSRKGLKGGSSSPARSLAWLFEIEIRGEPPPAEELRSVRAKSLLSVTPQALPIALDMGVP